ncbi:alpha/beta hydrolase [Caldimonas brevitalea]|uniref:Alpha/beta hydrolase n=1 Tax=Caldimonas brevitalea TaxID=413882 RepID=A0A0G3BG49_9BURK|nr:alpha/beta hydrolase [Caldimonas brevitalea]AKJ26943.1 alpha/beta hydrolase [Caldimonas brevitalea]
MTFSAPPTASGSADTAAAPEVSLSELAAADGTRLVLRTWPAPAGRQRGTVVIVHGLGEHSGRYEHVAQRLRSWGFAVVAYDHRGHGRSPGPRGALQTADDLLHDLAAVIDAARARHAGPLVLLGHSMGGLIAARFVAGAVRPVDLLVLSSPALNVGLSAFNRGLLRVSLALTPNLAVSNGLDARYVSRDPAVVSRYLADPLNHGKVTARLVRFIVDGGQYVRERARQWQVPTLLMWAGQDRLVLPAGSADFAELAPRDLVQCQCFPQMYHELFNEPDQDEVFNVLHQWLDQRLPAAAD